MAIVEEERVAQLNRAVVPVMQAIEENICVSPCQCKSLMRSAEELNAVLGICPLGLQIATLSVTPWRSL